ncbi:hypothetical protein Rumeso_04753 [Rubellimicrobium mesophilum DSM 19309]|uniref:Uncharacterized protein n=1 Tax=Rubellimicrobium mesophilum DSM 19309 TaxID=442562 RepID=A0A017HED4_9RHOB|nr:hypothetical protein [Rubellimicrobium mesophilum]EYD72877.1 hypothetical protein Rumeso_04753 [Rubellimicrobium mesophilum DSM 19309]
MATLGEILASAKRSSAGFERWIAAREPDMAEELRGAALAEGGSVTSFVRVAVADFARFASEEDWVQLTSRLRDSDDPGTTCLLSMVGWRMEQVRAHRTHASHGAHP